jgi:elongation factor 1-alpha
MGTSVERKTKPWISIATSGHVDHGKSTLCGFLLYRIGEVPESVLESIRSDIAVTHRDDKFFAYIMDRLPASRGLTPDQIPQTLETAYVGFETDEKRVMLVDNPGHPQYLSHLIRGIVNVDACLLVIAANEYEIALGPPYLEAKKDEPKKYITGYARQHAIINYSLGVEQLIVVVSKMDKVGFSQDIFETIKCKIEQLMMELAFKFKRISYVPTSVNVNAKTGENITELSAKMPWYEGCTLLQEISSCAVPKRYVDGPLRIVLDGLYDVKGIGRVAGGRVLSGRVRIGEPLVVEPGCIKGEVKSIRMRDQFKVLGREARWEDCAEASSGEIVSICLSSENVNAIEVGNVMGHLKNPPKSAYGFAGKIYVVWHPSASEIRTGRKYAIHIGTSMVEGEVIEILNVRGVFSEVTRESFVVRRGETAEIRVRFLRPVVIEKYAEVPSLGRFTFLIENIPAAVGTVDAMVAEVR